MTSDPRDEPAVPHFEDQLWVRLDELYRARYHVPAGTSSFTEVAPAGRRRALLAVAAVIVTLAIAALAAGRGTSFVSSGDWGSEPEAPGGTGAVLVVPGSAPGSTGSSGTAVPGGPVPVPVPPPTPPPSPSPPPSPDEVKARIIAALGPASGPWIIHQSKPGSESWVDQVTSAGRYQLIGLDGRVVREQGWPVPPGPDTPSYERLHPEVGFCDPASRLALDSSGQLQRCDPGAQPPQPEHVERIVDHCRRTWSEAPEPLVRAVGLGYIGAFLGTGVIILDGTEDIGGRRLIRLRNRAGTQVFHIDPDSYLPVRSTSTDTSPAFVITYEHLSRTPENLAFLSPPVPAGYVEVTPGAAPPPSPGC